MDGERTKRTAKRYTLKRLLRRPVPVPYGAVVTAEHDDGQLVVRIEPKPCDCSQSALTPPGKKAYDSEA